MLHCRSAQALAVSPVQCAAYAPDPGKVLLRMMQQLFRRTHVGACMLASKVLPDAQQIEGLPGGSLERAHRVRMKGRLPRMERRACQLASVQARPYRACVLYCSVPSRPRALTAIVCAHARACDSTRWRLAAWQMGMSFPAVSEAQRVESKQYLSNIDITHLGVDGQLHVAAVDAVERREDAWWWQAARVGPCCRGPTLAAERAPKAV
jgi:hypothetical protein